MFGVRDVCLPLALLVIASLSGCAGFIGGDLADQPLGEVQVPFCDDHPESRYRFTVTTDAEDDYFDQTVAGEISGWTLGLVPTYWMKSETTQAQVFEGDTLLAQYQYRTRVHRFYGLLWGLLLLPVEALMDPANILPGNEGEGLVINRSLRYRARVKTYLTAVQEHRMNGDDLCYFRSSRRR